MEQRQLPTKDVTISKYDCLTKPGIIRLLFVPVGIEPVNVGGKEIYATTEKVW
jgi:hypothetical protein